MAKDDKRHRRRLRKTKAELIAELEAAERRPATGAVAGGIRGLAPAIFGDAFLRAVIENAPTPIFIRDADSRFLMVNEAYERLRNVSDKKIVGKTPHEVFDKKSADMLIARDREVLESGKKVERESVLTLNDGSIRMQSTIAFPLYDSEGNAIGVCGIVSDLAKQKHAEQAVRVSEERLHAAIDSLQEGFALYDADDRLVILNEKYRRIRPAAQKIMDRGGTFEDVLRAHVALGLIPDAAGREEAFIQERLAQHRNPKGPLIRHFADGNWYLIDEARTPEGGTALSIFDITDIKNTENALRKSEALFRAVVNHSPTKIHIKDVAGRYTLINKEAEKLFGVTDKEGRGKTSYDLFPKATADAFMAHDRAVIESGRARENEEEFVLDDGIHTFLTVKFPIYDLDGVAAVGAIGTDITERKRAEETVRRLAAAIEVLSENFALYGPDDRLIMSNRHYRELNTPIAEATVPGISFEQHLRAMVAHGLAPQARGREEEWVRERLERHRNPGAPFEVPRQDGRWFLVREQRMADGSTATIATDITARKRAEKDLRAAKEQAEFASRAKTEFLANMSHELRTPLNSIIGLSEMLMNETLGPLGLPKYLEYAADIRSSGDHLLGLISEVLDLSKIEAGELEIIESEIDVTGAVSSCVRMIEGRAPEESPRVGVEFADGLPRLLGDERRFKQILLNLLGNAVKFTPLDGKVSVAARVCDSGRFTIEVADTGIGIAATDIPKVLEPFGQVRDVFTRTHEGTGLGLYLAKTFTEMHGGTLDIASRLGEGTTVTLRFPKERTVAGR